MIDYHDDPRWQALQEILVYEPPIQRFALDVSVRTIGLVMESVIRSQYATWAMDQEVA